MDSHSLTNNIESVVQRIGQDDVDKLILFTGSLKNKFESTTGIKIGTYLIGGVTYPEEIYRGEGAIINDLDIIVAAYDRKYLKPSKTNSVRCPLTKELKRFFQEGYMDEFLSMDTSEFKFSYEEMHSKRGKPSEHRFRPNILLNTPTGLPIHMIAQYKNPKVYSSISTSRKDQLTYDDAIAKELRHNNPFYVF